VSVRASGGKRGWRNARPAYPSGHILPDALNFPSPFGTLVSVLALQTKRWTRLEYERLIDLGVFGPDDRLELLGGQLVVAEPQDAEHYTAIMRASRAPEAAFGGGWLVRSQGPVALDHESEPEPDVAVVPSDVADYRKAHPTRPVLAVEVAVSSLALDRSHKGSLYALAGVPDYWIVNLVDRVIEIHREPTRDRESPYGSGYATLDIVTGGVVAPLSAPASRIAVTALLN
jgi:Uma2 family endonuclease